MSPLKSPLSAKLPPKQLLSPNKFDHEGKRGTLEKSNSLSESNPSKQLRTTKSLSPRAPIKHQVAVDEAPSVVVSEAVEKPRKTPKIEKKEVSNGLRVDIDQERVKNRSTGCLIYVPCDPWTKMDSTDSLSLSNNIQRRVQKE
jgi:hypothetical protein